MTILRLFPRLCVLLLAATEMESTDLKCIFGPDNIYACVATSSHLATIIWVSLLVNILRTNKIIKATEGFVRLRKEQELTLRSNMQKGF